ncbi:uncharacterized protein LOC133189168 [Saccostrea echinata]|uniref:uncharacterized protein LOC133189168 n=1 Tax=Saccostrea echinata TaxID=191078 RepID=UPI002A82D495|nr:uncharacterized protein LOC133189168 [Saccostrea echinata]XP_061180560.1 uncharacterized protein LOC133189168 [Saccostrea echinata]
MEEENRPCKRKRTDPEEGSSEDSCKNSGCNPDHPDSTSRSLNASQRNSNSILSHSDVDICSPSEKCSSKSNKSPFNINPEQYVPKNMPQNFHVPNSLYPFNDSKPTQVQPSPKVTISSENIASTSYDNNKFSDLHSGQGSSKLLDSKCDSCNCENVKSCEKSSDSVCPVNSDLKLNSNLEFTSDPLLNSCMCSSTCAFSKLGSNSPSNENSPQQICNPGFEVLYSPPRKNNSEAVGVDPECGEVDDESGEVDDESGETVRQPPQKSGRTQHENCDDERSTVNDIITSRRITKFKIQRSLGENSPNFGHRSWNSFGVSEIKDCDNVESERNTHSPQSDLKCENYPTFESLPITSDNQVDKLRNTVGSLPNKGVCFSLTAVNNINDLPPSILVNILKHLRMCDLLHKASLVCKLWHQLVYDPDLWRHVDLHYQHKVTDKQLLTLTQISDRVTHIDISDTQNLTSEAMERALKWCGHLRSLYMSRCYKLKDTVLQTVGSHCPHLVTLVMDGCYKITDGGLCAMAVGCKELQKVNLSRCSYHVTDKGVVAIAENCPQLREVILAYLSEVTDSSCVRLCEMCPNLEVVTLMFSGVSEKGVRALKQLRKLKIIDISSLPGILPTDVASLTQYCPDLEAMNVSLNPQINDECLLKVIKYGRKLHLLQCVSCHITDQFLGEIGKYTKTLKNLDIGWCQAVTDNGIRNLSATCTSLRYLGLIRCDAVTADAVEELVAQYPHITYSTFILESKKLIERARREGFMFNDDQNHVDMLV